MKDKNYKDLCNACDDVLLEGELSETRLAISWLHILKSESTYLNRYQALFSALNSTFKIHLLRLMFFYLSIIIIRILTGIRSSGLSINKNLKIIEKDVLFISHITNNDFFYKQNDLYFGDIPKRFSDASITSSTAFINHIGSNWNQSFKGDSEKIILSKSLTFIEEIKIFSSQIRESFRLKKSNGINNFHRRVIREAAVQVFSNHTANNLRLKMQVSKLIKEIKPKYVVTTLEGHAWERLIFSAIRKIDSRIKIVGYQHALINSQHSIFRSLGENTDPDIIATSGKIDLEELDNKIKNKKIVKVNIGSAKKGIKTKSVEMNTNTILCLVLADGDFTSCSKMLIFANNLAKVDSNVNFIFRLHPSMNIKSLLRKNKSLSKLSSNIRWSSSSLEDDLEHSNFALYRGSNAIYEAAYYNVMPIFFNNSESMDIDPLLDVSDKRPSISNFDQFFEILQQFNTEIYRLKNKEILKYCSNKFSDLNVEPLITILNKK